MWPSDDVHRSNWLGLPWSSKEVDRFSLAFLEKRSGVVGESLITSLLNDGNQVHGWTVDYQMARFKAEKRAKSPLRKQWRKKKLEVV